MIFNSSKNKIHRKKTKAKTVKEIFSFESIQSAFFGLHKDYYKESVFVLLFFFYFIFLFAFPLAEKNIQKEVLARQDNIQKIVQIEKQFYLANSRYANWEELAAFASDSSNPKQTKTNSENSVDFQEIKEPSRIYKSENGVIAFDQWTQNEVLLSVGARAAKNEWIFFCSRNVIESC